MSLELKDVAQFRWIWDNRGQYGPGKADRISLKDALSTTHAPLLFPRIISNIVKEAQEPLLIGASLLQRVNWSYGQTVTFPAMGAVTAAKIAEGQEYPEVSPSMGGSTVTANIGKHGVALSVTEEMVEYSQFDVIGMMLRAAGRALARHKEVQIFDLIRAQGVTVFDNLSPSGALVGVCTGRDIEGQANGSCTMDDVFDCFGHIVTQGYNPNTLLMHPLTWVMFVKDAQMREFVREAGGGSFFATWDGNPASRAPWGASSQGGLGVASGQQITPGQTATGAAVPHSQTASDLLAYSQAMNAAPRLPGYLNLPFRILVSPYVPYDPRRKLTDIYMFDSNYLGVLAVAEDVNTGEWSDPAREIRKIKLREKYGLGILEEGRAIGVMRNVHVVPNEIAMPPTVNLDISSKLTKIAPGTSLSL